MKTKFKGTEVNTIGDLPKVGQPMFEFKLVKTDLSSLTLDDIKGKKTIFNIFPSVDTGTCSLSVQKFNNKAEETKINVINVSMDLPFAHQRFNSAEKINNVTSTSDFQDRNFSKNSGLELSDSALKGLLARCVICVDEKLTIVHTQLVDEITQEPDYDLAIQKLQ